MCVEYRMSSFIDDKGCPLPNAFNAIKISNVIRNNFSFLPLCLSSVMTTNSIFLKLSFFLYIIERPF